MSLMGLPKKKWLSANWDSDSNTIVIKIERAFILENEQLIGSVMYGDKAKPFQGSVTFEFNVICRRAGGECI